MLTITPERATLGATVTGVDLHTPLDAGTVAALRDALVEHEVLFFPEANLEPAEQVRLGRSFGELQVHPVLDKHAGADEVVVFDTAENPAKIQFREWMLQTFPGDVIYDLQDVESTHPTTGARCEVGGVWRICQEIRSTRACLSPQSGPQGDDDSQGHICPVQGTRIAPSFLYALYLAVR